MSPTPGRKNTPNLLKGASYHLTFSFTNSYGGTLAEDTTAVLAAITTDYYIQLMVASCHPGNILTDN